MKQYIIKNLIDLIFENISYSNICNLQKFDILHASKKLAISTALFGCVEYIGTVNWFDRF